MRLPWATHRGSYRWRLTGYWINGTDGAHVTVRCAWLPASCSIATTTAVDTSGQFLLAPVDGLYYHVNFDFGFSAMPRDASAVVTTTGSYSALTLYFTLD